MLKLLIMRTKNVLIIAIIIIAIVAVSVAALGLLNQEHYKNVTMDGVTFEIKNSSANVSNVTDNFYIYNDTQNNITILLFDSEGMGLSDFGEATEFAVVRDLMQNDTQPQEGSNQSYNYTKTFDRYTYLTNYTHKNVFIITKDKEDMEHILSSIKVEQIVDDNNTENQTNNTTTNQQSSNSNQKQSSSDTQKSSTQREEDKITPDGWNPKEHETYRESMGGGDEKVHYDDGYFRVVNKKGDIITYGYGE